MTPSDIESQCELGQRLLMEMDYLHAERVLAEAEAVAWERRAWDVLSRLYLPLQETRRQRRQRCGEGTVCLDLLATAPDDAMDDPMDAARIVDQIPHGQLLVAGWQSFATAAEIRRLASERGLYLEIFLAAFFRLDREGAVVIAPTDKLPLHSGRSLTSDELKLHPDCIFLRPKELPPGRRAGTVETYAQTMSLWERLHAPFLARAEAESDPLEKMRLFRATIEVDYGCELAHQHLAAAAREQLRNTGGKAS